MNCPATSEVCMFSGDDLRLYVEVYDNDNTLVDISSVANITWSLSNDSHSVALVTKNLGGGTIVINTPTSFFFDLLPADTSALEGRYYHEAQIVTLAGLTYTAMSGYVRIKPTLIN